MVIPNISMPGKTLAIVSTYDDARELYKKLGQELNAWEVKSQGPDGRPRDMTVHIDPDNLSLNIGDH
jgi:hypothetical protein